MKRWLAIGALVAFIAVRIGIVVTWHKTGGDGVQYYRIAQQLRANNTFAFEPNKPSYSRLPGYPLFLAYLAAPGSSMSTEAHVLCATIWNVILDLIAAVCVWLTARRLRLLHAKALAIAYLAIPTLWLVSCYSMTESISTTLVAVELYFAVRLLEEPRFGVAVAAGAVAGFAQLIRLDAICALPMIAYACASAKLADGWSGRARLFLAFAISAAAVFAPWPLRNQARFGHPYFAASTSRTVSGKPFGDGVYAWARTWSDSAPGDSFFELYFVWERKYDWDRPGSLLPKSYDSPEERAKVVATLKRYNGPEGLSPRLDEDFHAFAKERFLRHPWRTLIVLPLWRLYYVFIPEPDYDMPMEVRWLGIPFIRPIFGVIDMGLTVLALVGAALAWRRHRALFWLTIPGFILRLGIYAFAIPHSATHRYLVEIFPLFVILAAIALRELAARLHRKS